MLNCSRVKRAYGENSELNTDPVEIFLTSTSFQPNLKLGLFAHQIDENFQMSPIKANIRTVLSTYRMFKSTRYFGNCQIPVFSLGVFQLCIIKSMKIWTQLVIEVARE